jgi:hypothetical protein
MKVNFFQNILNNCGVYRPSKAVAAMLENWWLALIRPVFYIRR